MKKINIGIIGYASIAKRMIIPALKELDQYNIVGIASRNEKNRSEIENVLGLKYFRGYEEILKCGLDAVYIPLPNGLHYAWVKKALNNGIHVLVEKSISCELHEVEELNHIARKNNLVLLENFQFQFHSQLNFIQNSIRTNELGEIRCIKSYFGFPPFQDDQNIRYKKELGGGSLYDAGAYPVKISQILLNEKITVDCATLFKNGKYDVDMWGTATLRGCITNTTVHIAFGFDNFYQNSLEIWGSKGKLSTNRIFTAGPGIEPEITIQNENGIKSIKIPSENHFEKILNYFHEEINYSKNLEKEYSNNITQAIILNQIKEYAK